LPLAGCSTAPPGPEASEGEITTLAIESLTFPPMVLPSFPPDGEAQPVTVTGYLTLPPRAGRLPAVVLAHGCSGIRGNIPLWVDELASQGIATLVLDSFGPRRITEVCTGREFISYASRLVDAYRALAVLQAHPRIDAARIALMGFSHGGRLALWASYARFRERWQPPGSPGFAAYLPFYAPCGSLRLIGDADVGDKPLRLFSGTADDWTPIEACRQYVERLRAAHRDVALLEYPGAHHGFDNPQLPARSSYARALNIGRCAFVEQPDGRFFEESTGRPPTWESPCIRRGATSGYSEAASRRAVEDVRTFLRTVFGQ